MLRKCCKSMNSEIRKALKVLKDGGSILYPTDTVWGIGCDATMNEALAGISDLKQGKGKSGFIVLMSGLDMVQRYVTKITDKEAELLLHQTRPTTLILQGAEGLADGVCAVDNSLAVRIPKDGFCLELIAGLGRPICSTSANLTGMKTPKRFSDIHTSILNGVNHIVNLHQDKKLSERPSSILKIGAKSEIIVIRK